MVGMFWMTTTMMMMIWIGEGGDDDGCGSNQLLMDVHLTTPGRVDSDPLRLHYHPQHAMTKMTMTRIILVGKRPWEVMSQDRGGYRSGNPGLKSDVICSKWQ